MKRNIGLWSEYFKLFGQNGGFFGMATIRLMTVFVYLGNVLKQKARQKLQKLIPVFIVCMGCLFILRGLGLNIPYIFPGPVVNEATYNIQCH